MDRRQLLKAMGATGIALAGGSVFAACIPEDFGLDPDPSYGPLGSPDANGLRLPAGFTSRVIATTDAVVPATTGPPYTWHKNPDGGACFAASEGGWIYVSNSESIPGGASMVRFASNGTIVQAKSILANTNINCAGGATPWGSWLSCEEFATGQVWECDPTGFLTAAARPGMGKFAHEAAAADPVFKAVYLTEDTPDGGFYRFVPTTWGDLTSGRLDVMTEVDGALSWVQVPNPTPGSGDTPTRNQVPNTKRFNGGEGVCVDQNGAVFFTTKGDGRVWALAPGRMELVIVYDDNTSPTPELTNVDNITLNNKGVLFVAEDPGNLQIVAVGKDQKAAPVVELTGVTGSEIAGPAFSPDGQRLYFSSQRNPGRTYEVAGPWR